MIVRDYGIGGFRDALASAGATLRIGPFNVNYKTRVAAAAEALFQLYPHQDMAGPDDFIDIWLEARSRPIPAQPWRKRAMIYVDGRFDTALAPARLATPGLEWSLNLAMATRSHFYLILHAAVIAKDGRAVVMPAPPGSGKSTLAAALSCSGWRLFSDEFALIDPASGLLVAAPRPVSLKNASIDVMRAFAGDRVFRHVYPGTLKGVVGYYVPDAEHIRHQDEPATPRWIIQPQWKAGAALDLKKLPDSGAFSLLNMNAVNYDVLGEEAFRSLASLSRDCDAYLLEYSKLEDAIAAFDRLASEA